MSSIRPSVIIGLSALFLTTGCELNETGETDTVSDAQAMTEGASTSETNSAASSSLWQGGAQVPLDIQVSHPNGVVLQLTSLQSRETETAVGVRVINGADNEIDLNRYNNRDGYIVVESGERLYISPPPSNTDLSIQPGQSLEGELVFLGRLPQTQNAVLVLNENSSTDSEHTRVPGFRIDLPLSGGAPAGATG